MKQSSVKVILVILMLATAFLAGRTWGQPQSGEIGLVPESPTVHLKIDQVDSVLPRFLSLQGAEFRVHDDRIDLKLDSQTIKALRILQRYNKLQEEVCIENSYHEGSLTSEEGGPYQKRFVRLNRAGQPIVSETHDRFLLAYDPAHPNADERGYVKMPNINAARERRQAEKHHELALLYRRLLEHADQPGNGNTSVSYFESGPLPAPTYEGQPARDGRTGLELSVPPPSVTTEDLGPPLKSLNLQKVVRSKSLHSGQASVCYATQRITGQTISIQEVYGKYGFCLLDALNDLCKHTPYRWRDGGDLSEKSWPLLEEAVARRHLPVLFALGSNQPRIVVITDIRGDWVTVADPTKATKCRWSRRQLLEKPYHGDGPFLFLPCQVKTDPWEQEPRQLDGEEGNHRFRAPL